MLSINDHPDIRAAFAGMTMHEIDIRYSVANNQGRSKESGELVIMNYDQVGNGGLF
jgi:DNA adenine methylase